MNQIVSGLILLNKPNTELSGFIKKKKKTKNGTGGMHQDSNPGSPAWLLATLPTEPRISRQVWFTARI